ncbi:MAG: hypothetical protein Q8S71_02325 [Hydrogenophaga sp.]|jgi:hypothetical protein|nr:hypothetical protein [Hydrogenophaga sp.]
MNPFDKKMSRLKHRKPVDYETRFPTFDEMAAFMDAEMARMGIAQPGATA